MIMASAPSTPKAGWEVKTLGEVCGFVRGPFGGSLKKSFFKPDGFAVYEQQHAINDQFESIRYFIDDKKFDEMQRFELRYGDLIMSCSGTMGKVAIVPEGIKRGIINQALLKLTPNKELKGRYLKFWMESPNFQEEINNEAQGVAIKNVASVKVLKGINLNLPPLPEQERIVGILDEAFEGIAAATAQAEKNLHNARELFQSVLQSTFSQKGDDWEETTIGEQLTLQRGFDITKKEQNPGEVPVVSSGGVKSYHDTSKVEAPGVVVGRKGTIGKVHFIETDFWPHDTTLWVKDFKENHPRLIYYFLSGLELSGLDRNQVKIW